MQTPEVTLQNASGSCRDSAWLLVQLLRHLGLAARFVSGYLIQLKSDVKSLDGPSGTEVDFTDLHAWCEVYLPGAGWIGLDPTSGLLRRRRPHPARLLARAVVGGADQRHARCRARRPSSTTCRCAASGKRRASPCRTASCNGARSTRSASRSTPICARRRPPDARRRADLRLGRRPRRRRMEHRGDGADQAAPERRADGAPARALRRRAACSTTARASGIPGEQLPRWSLNLFWRRDGVPIWHDPALLANERDDHGATAADAARVPASPGAAPRRRPAQRLRRLRRRLATTSGARASCRSTSTRPIRASPIRPSASACAGCSSAASASRSATRCRSRADERQPGRWRSSALVPAQRPLLPGPGRFAARLPPAARLAAVGARRATCPGSIRPTPTTSCRRFPAAQRAGTAHGAGVARVGRRRADVGVEHETPSGTARAPAADAARRQRLRACGRRARRIGRLRRPHRDQRRGARTAGSTSSCRRPRRSRTTSRSSPRSRTTARGDAAAGDARRLRAAERPAPRRCCASRPTRA